METKEIIIVFKTHLDLGFTDFAGNVLQGYLESYIPQALALAKKTREKEARFVWTVGSWMLQKYLESGRDPQELEDAVKNGDIRWHALPFTTHTEVMNPELFRYGLSISQGLDRKFGMKTIAAKLTDVPGHTRAVVPMLAQAGVRFLHIGVNPASTVPQVPSLFLWRAPSGEEIMVMYNGSYGEMTPIGNSGTAVYFAHTGDNHGPQSEEQIEEIYRQLREKYPDAVLRAGTLEDVAQVALQETGLPVITDEIGDSWIHGAGTDPAKVNGYRGMLRLAGQLPAEEAEKIYRELLPVPEHTWGLDEKTHLGATAPDGSFHGEHRYFVRSEFEAVRSTEKFQMMERSWEEQREYVKNSVKVLDGEVRRQAETILGGVRREPTDLTGFEKLQSTEAISLGGCSLSVDAEGAINGLTANGKVWADQEHRLCAFLYQIFSEKEYTRFRNQYVTDPVDWALEDFGKIGIDKAVSCGKDYRAVLEGAYRKDNTLVLRSRMPEETVKLYGGAELLETVITVENSELHVDFAWFGKKANRIAEAYWLGFQPAEGLTEIQKVGEWMDPTAVVDNGNKHMHAVWEGVKFGGSELKTLDTALINIGEPALLNFTNDAPNLNGGVYFNLFNNIWGTNFPMWYDEDARFRFTMNLQ